MIITMKTFLFCARIAIENSPLHEGIFVTQAEMAIIQRLRSQQGLLKAESSNEIYDLTDPSVHGDINMMQHKGFQPPVPWVEIFKTQNMKLLQP